MKKEQPKRDEFYMEGNRGGDYLRLVRRGDRVYVEVGHSCVVYVSHIIPIEILTSSLAAFWSDNEVGDGLERLMDWDRIKELKSRIEKTI